MSDEHHVIDWTAGGGIAPGQPFPKVDDPDSRSLPAAPSPPVSTDELDLERQLFGHTQDA